MAKQSIALGSTLNDGTGDPIRTGGDKINDNFDEIYTLLGDGTTLTSGLSATTSVVTLAAPTITSVASFAAGSASAPSITKTGDTDTGIFFSAANEVAITTGGTQRLKVDNSNTTFAGNVLIPNAGTIGSASDTDAMAISSGGVVSFTQDISLVDGKKVVLGTNSDIGVQYDETTSDSLLISADVEGAALGVVFSADQGDDASDKWKMNFANGGTFTFGNDIASKDTFVSMLTITPHATASSATMAFTGSITAAGNAVKTVGKETIYVPAAAMYPTTTHGCAALTQVELATPADAESLKPELKCLDFDPSADENAQFTVSFPKSWNESTITFKAYFTVSGTNTGTVSWALAGVSCADNDAINASLGTAVAPTAKAHSGTSGDVNVTAESGNITIAGSPSTDEMVFFNIRRDVSADSQTGDARLLGIQIFFTTDAANDA